MGRLGDRCMSSQGVTQGPGLSHASMRPDIPPDRFALSCLAAGIWPLAFSGEQLGGQDTDFCRVLFPFLLSAVPGSLSHFISPERKPGRGQGRHGIN